MLIEKKLLCHLTDAEVMSRGRVMSETIAMIDQVQSARTQANKEFKEKITGLQEEQRKLAAAFVNRVEERLVECVVLFHRPSEGIKRIVRSDTGEVVSEEEMTDQEKQLNLFGNSEKQD